MQSIKQYGVFDNVFTKQELISDNIKEKEEKIAFLQKLINHVCKLLHATVVYYTILRIIGLNFKFPYYSFL